MSEKILIVGKSGSGKSSSIEKLDPKETFIIAVVNKGLPFKGWKKRYSKISKENKEGNYIVTDNPREVVKLLFHIDKNMPNVKHIVIDDSQYLMANPFMSRVNEKGFDKFNQIGQEMWMVIDTAGRLSEDKKVYFLHHAEEERDGLGNPSLKAKTLGKLLDNVITIEGMFTVVLFTCTQAGEENEEYFFMTNSGSESTCKSPKGMFEDKLIPNDLTLVAKAIDDYES